LFTFEILFAEAIAATVVLYLIAIAYNESPDLTVYILGDEEPLRPPVEPASPSAGIATAMGTVSESPVFNNCGFALTSSLTVTPYLFAIDSNESPAATECLFGFDESAREAALSAQFRPGRRDGVAVEMETRLAIRFLLEGPPR